MVWRRRILPLVTATAVVVLGPMVSADQSSSGFAPSVCNTENNPQDDASDPVTADADREHAEIFVRNRFPSAASCAQCHPNHYRQWSVSPHAYAQISPVFNAMQGSVLKLTNGTNGDFCIRCHSPVGMTLGEPAFTSNINRHPVSREGVTCIVCHRVNRAYGKASGRIAIVPGGITDPIYGPTGDQNQIQQAVERGAATNDPTGQGRKIHGRAEKFFRLTTAASCGMCHDVTLASGFREIEAFSDYKSSPAAKRGVTCQDCHMGKHHGRYTGDKKTNYAWGPAARVGDQWTAPRKLTNHMMIGADLSVVHPALFPLRTGAIKEASEKDDSSAHGMATIRQWLDFDWQAGWGTDEFEDSVSDDERFPERWASVDDRYDAREIIQDQLTLLKQARRARLELLRNGYRLGDVVVERADDRQIRFKVQVHSGTDGHSVPTSLDAERLVWLHVVVVDRDGNRLMESGDLDPNGDLRDLHSAYVRQGELALDQQLFNLQTRFIARNLRGGEREQVLTVNTSLSPLPFVRPSRRASILLGRPLSFRKHKKSIEPLGHRWAHYVANGGRLGDGSPYTLNIALKAAAIPVNLVNEIKEVGFDYGMTPRQVADTLVAMHEVIWSRQLEVTISRP